jgi:hypothetical protein
MIVTYKGYTYTYNDGEHLLITAYGDNVYLTLTFDEEYVPTKKEVIEVIDRWILLNT